MLILDTDLLTIIQFRRGALYERIVQRIAELDEDVAVPIISFEEQLRGWLALIARKRTGLDQLAAYERLAELFEDFRDRSVLRFDAESARIFDDLRRAHRRKGTMDLKIAGVALANQAMLATRNLADYEGIEGLMVVDLTSSA